MLNSLVANKTFALAFALSLALAAFYLASPRSWSIFDMGTLLGGQKPANDAENSLDLDDLGKFAVDQQKSRQNSDLTFVKVLSAKQQVVSGTMYHLTIQAETGGETKTYDAKVWVKPWQNFKSLESFEPAKESPITKADLGAPTDDPDSGIEIGLRPVPADDPVVKEAAQKALEVLQQRSNSLVPYELKDVVSAQAEVNEDITKFELVLKIGRGDHEEQSKAEVERTVDGKWTVKYSQLHY